MRACRLMWTVVSAILWLGLFGGCDTVTVSAPLSDPALPSDRQRLEGDWRVDRGIVSVKFSADGIAHIAGVEWDGDRFSMMQAEMVVSEGNPDNFLSVRFREDERWTERYLIVQYRFSDSGDLVLWRPNVAEFERAVQTRLLKGEVRKESYSSEVLIDETAARMLAFLNDPQRQNLFVYREPVVLHRLD